MNVLFWDKEQCDAMIDRIINVLQWPIFPGPVILPYAPLKSSDFAFFHLFLHSKYFSFIDIKAWFRWSMLSCDTSYR